MKKFAIIIGQNPCDTERIAVEELTKILLEYTMEYPVCVPCNADDEFSDFHRIYIGTAKSNRRIFEMSRGLLEREESYSITVKDDNVIIEGFDAAGVLYGVLDFYNHYIVRYEYPDDDRYRVNFLNNDVLPDFEYTSSPDVKERGLWTWGHVIYDYRGYLDNMMKLKMNRVIIWNDYLPFNAKEIVAYAHARNIKVYWGFAWLWDTDCKKFDFEHTYEESKRIFSLYESEYADTGADGIYFQTFTELLEDTVGETCIAQAASDFVNRTAARFYEKYPQMDILFGLHATSVKNRLEFIANVDTRIRIVWENCGAFPFSYIPKDIQNFGETEEFVQKIARLRGEADKFGVVTKGFVKLDWSSFEHSKGAHCIGVATKSVKENRIERKSRIWRYIQAQWLAYADKAYEMVREMQRLKNGNLCVYALVEDGMFEENIMYPVALYAEMLWNCNEELPRLMSNVAMQSYVSFA